ncbi:hypothetical protein ACE6H2_003909 [Prunus campanulata]
MQPNFCLRDKVSPWENDLRAQGCLFCLFPFVGFLFLLLVQYCELCGLSLCWCLALVHIMQ